MRQPCLDRGEWFPSYQPPHWEARQTDTGQDDGWLGVYSRAGAIAEDRGMQLAQALIETHCHVSAFFRRSNEEYKIRIPFLKEGIDVGDNAVDALAPGRRPEHVRRLNEAGVRVGQAPRAAASSNGASGRTAICARAASIGTVWPR